MPEATKRCTKCSEVKPVSDFGRDSKAPDGLFYWCAACVREHDREYREANREKMRERDRERYHADPERARERVRRYREANRDVLRERSSAPASDGRTCAVEGCDGKPRGQGFCGMHYARWKRTGDPGLAGKKNLPVPEKCTVEGCPRPPRAKGLCATHWSRLQRHGNPEVGAFKPRGSCGVVGCSRPHAARGYCSQHYWMLWKHGDPEPGGYMFAHQKVYRLRGAARKNPCQHCGGRARHWAYDHGDPDVRLDPRLGLPFSVNPYHYIPLCARCHKIFDNGQESAVIT